MLIFLFGYPGAGKNFVGEILRVHFGFFFYDADELLTEEMKKLINTGEGNQDKIFSDYIERRDDKFIELKLIHHKLVLAQVQVSVVWQSQEKIAKLLQNAIFIRVIAPIHLINQRLVKRNHFVGANAVKKTIENFEDPKFHYEMIHNDEGEEKIITQLNKILKMN